MGGYDSGIYDKLIKAAASDNEETKKFDTVEEEEAPDKESSFNFVESIE